MVGKPSFAIPASVDGFTTEGPHLKGRGVVNG